MDFQSFKNIFNNYKNFIKKLKFPIWFKDDILKQLFKNAGALLSGNLIAWVFGFLTLALTARILGLTQFGILILIVTYVAIIDTLVNFQSWQALIKYGAEALEKKHDDDFKGIVKFCILLDITTAVVATILAIVIVSEVGRWLSWENTTISMTAIYSIVILFNIKGTPTGILRLFNRFRLFAIQNIISSIIKFVGIVIIYHFGGGLWEVLLLWMITTILGQLILLGLGLRELRLQGFERIYNVSLGEMSVKHPGIWGFIVTTNLNSSVRLGSREVDTMLVGGIVGAEGAGLYKIAKQIAAIPSMLSDPLYQAIYPDLSRLWAKKEINSFRKLMIRSGIVAGLVATAIWIVFIFIGTLLIQLFFGPEFIGAQPVLVWYMLALVIAIFGFPLQPAMLSMGRPKISFLIQILCTVIYFPILIFFLDIFGVVGAGVSYVCYYLLWTGLMILMEISYFKEKGAIYEKSV